MRLALIQTKQNCLYEFDKNTVLPGEEILQWQAEMIEQNFRLLQETTADNCDLIVTTEAINFCGQPGRIGEGWEQYIIAEQDRLLLRFANAARIARSYLVAGMYRHEAGSGIYNAAVVFDRSGNIMKIYDKIHLAGDENDYLQAGTIPVCVDMDFGRVGICICWDAQFPETFRLLSLAGAQLVVCPTWGWEQIYGHARAYENGIFTAAAMAIPYAEDISGIRTPSEVISPEGEILCRASRNSEEVVLCEIELKNGERYRKKRMSGRRPECYHPLCE